MYVWPENIVSYVASSSSLSGALPEVLHINFQLASAATSKRVRVPVRFSCFSVQNRVRVFFPFSNVAGVFFVSSSCECVCWWVLLCMCVCVCECSLCNVVWAGKVVWSFSLDLVAKMATGWQKGTRQQQQQLWRRRRRRVKNKHLHYVSRRN